MLPCTHPCFHDSMHPCIHAALLPCTHPPNHPYSNAPMPSPMHPCTHAPMHSNPSLMHLSNDALVDESPHRFSLPQTLRYSIFLAPHSFPSPITKRQSPPFLSAYHDCFFLSNSFCPYKQALPESSHMYDEAQHLFAAHGVKVAGTEVDLPAMMAQKSSAVAALTKNIEVLLKKNKVTYLKGLANIVAPHDVAVSLLDSPEETKIINARNIIIATGLPAVLKKLVVLGGGAIGLELGSMWGRLGAEVTVVELTDSIGGSMDREIRHTFQRALEKQGFKFVLATKVVSADASGSRRVPYTDGLGLDEVGVKKDKEGRILVDGQFQSSVPSVFAIGDVISGPMLAHKAEAAEGIACVENLVGAKGYEEYSTIPWIIYTHPEVAMVGKTEEDLKQSGMGYRMGQLPFTANSRGRATGDTKGIRALANF
ncbi:unnamed protein product [Closterium sp. Yama58-4]|nr:unnamed protein product [Closterium sp. Yama58-4]